MNRLEALLAEYGESHQNPVNKAIHWLCVPLITISLLGILASLSTWLVAALVVGAMIYYLSLSRPLAVGMLLFTLASWLLLSAIPSMLVVSLWVFVLAWIGQFIGHKIEGKKPSFFTDVQFLLIGPLWVLNALYQKFDLRTV